MGRIRASTVKALPVDYGKENITEDLKGKSKLRINPVNEKYEMQLQGITETTDFVNAYFSIWEGFEAAYRDSELTTGDLVHFSSSIMAIMSALNGASKVLGELKNLSYEEKNQLLKRADAFDLGRFYWAAFNSLDSLLTGIRTFNALTGIPSIDTELSADTESGSVTGE